MKIYHYHPVTCEYFGNTIADESPRDKGVFLIPAHATNKEPPAPEEGKVIVFQDDGWQLIDIPKPPEEIPEGLTEEVVPEEIPKELTEEEIKEHHRQDILQQLSGLSKIVSDSEESKTKFMVEKFGYEPPQSELDLISQKQALRLQLAELAK